MAGMEHLQGWPAATVASGDMGEVGYDKSVLIGSFALQANAVASWSVRVEDRRCVDTHVYLVVLHLDEALGLSLLLVDIGDEAV